MTWKALAKRVWSEMQSDEIFGRSAQLSYYFLLALFPLLLFLTTLLGYFADTGTELRDSLIGYLGKVMPTSATDLVHTTVDEISKSAGGGKLSFGLIATLWAASNGMGAISDSLNVAYDVRETRPWWKVRLVTVALTIALAVLIISALVLLLYGGEIAQKIALSFGLGSYFTIAWKILQWPIVLGFVVFAFSLIYYFAPNRRGQKWELITPGAVIGLLLWLFVSFAFRTYLRYFDSYSVTYGGLGAVIVMMLWFYLTGAAILIGGEINSEIVLAGARSHDKEDEDDERE
jgi:membrane protein